MTIHKFSASHQLERLGVGDSIYIETSHSSFGNTMRQYNPARPPKELIGRKFSTTLFTAISAKNVGDVRYLVRVSRIA